jgi:hypothetical protein
MCKDDERLGLEVAADRWGPTWIKSPGDVVGAKRRLDLTKWKSDTFSSASLFKTRPACPFLPFNLCSIYTLHFGISQFKQR